MEEIYYWIGWTVIWLSASIGSIFLIGVLLKIILNKLGNTLKVLWYFVEFFFYRETFKEWIWIKDKDRHPKCN